MTVCFFCVCFFPPFDACEDSAGQYFEQSLSAYKNCAGPESPAFLTAQDDFCRYLLVSGQQEVRLPPGNTHKHLSLWWITPQVSPHLIFLPSLLLVCGVFILCTSAEVCGDPESFSPSEDLCLWRAECRGGGHPPAPRKRGDDSGKGEAGSQDHDKGDHKSPRTHWVFDLVTTCKQGLVQCWPAPTCLSSSTELPKCLGGFSERPGVSGCVGVPSKYTHKEPLSFSDDLFPPSSLKLGAIRVAC